MVDTMAKNVDVESPELKKAVIKMLTAYNVPLRTEMSVLQTDEELAMLTKREYTMVLRHTGVRSLLVLFKKDDVFYAVNFAKHDHNTRTKVSLHATDCRFEEALYQGTVMEGIFYMDGDVRTLILDELYVYRGDHQTGTKFRRLLDLTEILKRDVIMNDKYRLVMAQHYPLNRPLMSAYTKIRSDPMITEVMFYPVRPGGTIYHYTVVETDLQDSIIKRARCLMRSTGKVDVYGLYTRAQVSMGMAMIPDIKTSHMCAKWIKISQEVAVICEWDGIHHRWVPIALDD